MFALAAVLIHGSVVTPVLRSAAMILVPSQSSSAMCSINTKQLEQHVPQPLTMAQGGESGLYVHS